MVEGVLSMCEAEFHPQHLKEKENKKETRQNLHSRSIHNYFLCSAGVPRPQHPSGWCIGFIVVISAFLAYLSSCPCLGVCFVILCVGHPHSLLMGFSGVQRKVSKAPVSSAHFLDLNPFYLQNAPPVPQPTTQCALG